MRGDESREKGRGEAPAATDRIVRLRMERRRGKPVTVLAAEGLGAGELKEIAGELKTRCGAGGSVKGTDVVIQGDCRERAREFLRARGIRVKG